jgi:hypothetical protein
MSEDKLSALVPEMNPVNFSDAVPSNTNVAGTFGGRAPVLPRVVLPACFDPSTVSACRLQM